jgi:hypothetical protein
LTLIPRRFLNVLKSPLAGAGAVDRFFEVWYFVALILRRLLWEGLFRH